MRQRLIAISLLATWACVTLVAQSRYLPDARPHGSHGGSSSDADNRRVLGARPADLKELEAQLLRLNAIIKKTDGFANPIGFSVETVGDFRPPVGLPVFATRRASRPSRCGPCRRR